MKRTLIISYLLFVTQILFAEKNDTVSKGKSFPELNNASSSSIQKKSTFFTIYYGLSNYLGDLGGNRGIGKKFIYDNNFKKRTFFVGASFSYIKKEAVGLRLSYVTGNIAGSDQDASFKNQSDDAYTRFKRNLDFQSKISEWSLLLEVYPLKFIHRSNKISNWNIQPYLLAGLGRYKFNPQGSYYDEISDDFVWVDLQPLRTEGEGMKEYPNRKPYKLVQMNMPYGIGFKYTLGSKTSMGFEFVGRKLFTDYLDDASTSFIDPSLFSQYLNEEDAAIAKAINNKSNLIEPNSPYHTGDQRGNSKCNDFYYSFNLKFSVQLNKRKDRTVTEKPNNIPLKRKEYKYDNSEICD